MSKINVTVDVDEDKAILTLRDGQDPDLTISVTRNPDGSYSQDPDEAETGDDDLDEILEGIDLIGLIKIANEREYGTSNPTLIQAQKDRVRQGAYRYELSQSPTQGSIGGEMVRRMFAAYEDENKKE